MTDEESPNPIPKKPPPDMRTPEQKALEIKMANKAYWEAMGCIEAFWSAYPDERPPERERRGRGGR